MTALITRLVPRVWGKPLSSCLLGVYIDSGSVDGDSLEANTTHKDMKYISIIYGWYAIMTKLSFGAMLEIEE